LDNFHVHFRAGFLDFVNQQKRTALYSFVTKVLQVPSSAPYKTVMALTKSGDRTAEQQSVWKAQQAADLLESAARRARRALRWASSNPPDSEVEIETLLQLNLWNLGLVWFYRDFSQVPFGS